MQEPIEALCAFASLRSAARAASQLYDLALRPVDLRASEVTLLRVIGEAGEVAQWMLARDHATAIETLSRRLASLRRKGLVSLRKSDNHHGERIYSLTPSGQESLDRALPYWDRAQERLRETLGESQFAELLQICRYGAIFKITPSGTLTVIHSFDGTDGNYPLSGLTLGSDAIFTARPFPRDLMRWDRTCDLTGRDCECKL